MAEQCSGCRFWREEYRGYRRGVKITGHGICRRGRPAIVGDEETTGFWPAVPGEEWCGEFEAETPAESSAKAQGGATLISCPTCEVEVLAAIYRHHHGAEYPLSHSIHCSKCGCNLEALFDLRLGQEGTK